MLPASHPGVEDRGFPFKLVKFQQRYVMSHRDSSSFNPPRRLVTFARQFNVTGCVAAPNGLDCLSEGFAAHSYHSC